MPNSIGTRASSKVRHQGRKKRAGEVSVKGNALAYAREVQQAHGKMSSFCRAGYNSNVILPIYHAPQLALYTEMLSALLSLLPGSKPGIGNHLHRVKARAILRHCLGYCLPMCLIYSVVGGGEAVRMVGTLNRVLRSEYRSWQLRPSS